MFKNQYEDGDHKINYSDGTIYYGYIKNNQKVYGLETYTSENVYIGDYKNGKKNGWGSFYFADGDRYIGYFKDNMRHGSGTYYWNNGDMYEGEWKNGKRDGEGTLYVGSNEFKCVYEKGERIKKNQLDNIGYRYRDLRVGEKGSKYISWLDKEQQKTILKTIKGPLKYIVRCNTGYGCDRGNDYIACDLEENYTLNTSSNSELCRRIGFGYFYDEGDVDFESLDDFIINVDVHCHDDD